MQIKSQLTLNHALWGAKYWILFAIFLLVALKVSDKNEHIPYIFDWVPLLGGTLPYTLTGLVIMLAFSANGGKFSETGLFWPPSKTLWRGLLWIMGFAVLTLFARASVPMLLGPLFDLIGPRHSSAEHFQSLVNNLPLLLVILPLMWIVVFF